MSSEAHYVTKLYNCHKASEPHNYLINKICWNPHSRHPWGMMDCNTKLRKTSNGGNVTLGLMP